MRLLLRQNYRFLIAYFILLLVVGAVLLSTPKHAAFFFINGHHTPFFDYFFWGLTNIGDGVFYALVTLGLLLVRFRWALLSLVNFIMTSLVAQVLKQVVFTGHPRPYWYFQEHAPHVALHLVRYVSMNGLKSFPSGHSTSAFSVFLVLSIVVSNKKWGYFFLLLAALAAYSRVYLAQHFVEDVYAGSLLGVGLTLVLTALLNRYLDSHARPWHQWRLQGLRLQLVRSQP